MQRIAARIDYYLGVDATEVHVDIPVIDITGKHEGPTLVLIGGLHGDEYEATAAIIRVCQEIDPAQLYGRVISIPIGNPLACSAQSRTTPRWYDGKNLARSFPGDPSGSPTLRIADRIWKFILQNCDSNGLILDLHSGGQHYSYEHMAGVRNLLIDSPQSIASMQAARAMMIENLWLIEPTPGTLSTVAIASGIPAIACEMEGRGGLNHEDVSKYLDSIKNIMKFKGNTFGGEAKLGVGKFSETITVQCKKSGFASYLPENLSVVREGEVICKIINPFGVVVENVLAPCSGVVWASRTNPSVGIDEIIALIKVS